MKLKTIKQFSSRHAVLIVLLPPRTQYHLMIGFNFNLLPPPLWFLNVPLSGVLEVRYNLDPG